LKGSSKEKCGHPSQKPIDLIAKLIACASDPGDLVLDPFLGSGTTSVVAQSLGRQWLGIEINSDYVEIARERLDKAGDLFSTPKPPRKPPAIST
jgi:site-specific DNA-methyltransferase (adenine-specific)